MKYFKILMYILIVITIIVVGRCMYRMLSNKKEKFVEPQQTLLFFYADWCPHCTNFKPEVVKFKQNNVKNTNLDVKILEESKCPKELLAKHDVKGFPTVVLVKNVNGQENTDVYRGERTADGLQRFIDLN